MKLVEKYLYAISRQLPREGKDEVIKELESSLLDSIEDMYGPEPTEADITEVLKSFGSPSDVAKEYGKKRFVIDPQLTDLYFMIAKIIVFAMLGAFTVSYMVRLFVEEDFNYMIELLGIFGNIVMGSISAIGSLTLVFIIIGRYMTNRYTEESWEPKMLEELPSDKEAVSFIGTMAGIIFSVIFIVGFNLFPEMMNTATDLMRDQGFELVHSINMEQFRRYLLVLNIIWISTIVHSILTLVKMRYTKSLRVMEIILNCASIGLFYVMVRDELLYTGPYNFIGFRSLFLVLTIVIAIDTVSNVIKFFVRD